MLLGSLQGNTKISVSFREEHSRGSLLYKCWSVLSRMVLLHLSLAISSVHDNVSDTLLGIAASMSVLWGREGFTGKFCKVGADVVFEVEHCTFCLSDYMNLKGSFQLKLFYNSVILWTKLQL